MARASGIFDDVLWLASNPYEATRVRRWFGRKADVRVAPDLRVAPSDEPDPGEPNDGPPLRVAFVSRISPKKNLEGALEILARVRSPVVFDIYGPREDAIYWRRCESAMRALPQNVGATYRGILPGAEVHATLARYDLLLLPTFGENYGHVIAEALAAGCPPLICDRTPWRDLVGSDAGWDLPVGDHEAFRAVLEACADEPATRGARRGRRQHAGWWRIKTRIQGGCGPTHSFWAWINRFEAANVHTPRPMDYTRAPLIFRTRKAARYVRLYGPRRTLAKVRGQYHMRTTGPLRGLALTGTREDAHVGLIGCGNFAFSHIAYFLERDAGRVMRGAMDVEGARAESLARRYGLHYATDDADGLIEDPAIDLVYIASNHATHAEYAVRALRAGKSVHIEKPHVVDDDQLSRLCEAMGESAGAVRLGFNRPDSELGVEVRRLLAAQSGPLMVNWFVAGHELPQDHWYYRPEEGGRILGNLCHWTDFSLRLIEPVCRYPISIRPTRAEQSDCDIAVSYVFGDGSIAAITFSAKGHAFEGVREHLELHRGDLLLALDDFKELRANVRERRHRMRLRFRDHGQRAAIMRSYAMTGRSGAREPGVDVSEVWETAQLFLRTREALEKEETVSVEAFPSGTGASAARAPL